jgi:hypothetical protein
MRTMTYTCGTTQHRVVDLIAPDGIMVNRIESLRTHAWDVELAAHGIDSAALNASTVQLEAKCADLTMLDTASNLFDADIRALASTGNRNKAGTITVDPGRTHHRHRTITRPSKPSEIRAHRSAPRRRMAQTSRHAALPPRRTAIRPLP